MKAQCCHRYLQLDYPQSIGKQLTDFCQLLASETGVDSANYSFQFLIICLDTQSLAQLFSFLFFSLHFSPVKTAKQPNLMAALPSVLFNA